MGILLRALSRFYFLNLLYGYFSNIRKVIFNRR